MKNKTELYATEAEKAQRAAAAATNMKDKMAWLKIAQTWQLLLSGDTPVDSFASSMNSKRSNSEF